MTKDELVGDEGAALSNSLKHLSAQPMQERPFEIVGASSMKPNPNLPHKLVNA